MEYQQEKHIVMPQDQLMDEAKAALSGKWGVAAVAALIMIVLSLFGELGDFASLLAFVFTGPITVGVAFFHLKIAREEEVDINMLFEGFKMFGKALGAYLLMMIAIFIGVLLLIIPGIIAALGLSQTFYILNDDPEIGIVDALKFSWELTDGHKFDLFILGLRFLGWILLSILTLGIGFFFLIPYMNVTFAKFYNSIRYGDHHSGPEDYEDDIMNHLVD